MTAKRLLVPLVLTLCWGTRAAAQATSDDAAKAGVVRHLLEINGVAAMMQRTIANLIPAERASNPTVPPAFWDAFAARVQKEVPVLIDSLVPIYTKRFTLAELKQVVQFYESPVGKHLSAAQPDMLQESQQIGTRWGAALGKQIADSLQGVKN